jgi:hypothetical protein
MVRSKEIEDEVGGEGNGSVEICTGKGVGYFIVITCNVKDAEVNVCHNTQRYGGLK